MSYIGIKKKMKLRWIADKVVSYLLTLPSGTKISTSEAVETVVGCEFLSGGDYRIGDMVITSADFFYIDEAVWKKAKKNGAFLDNSEYYMQPLGMPFHIPYTVVHTK